MMRGLIFGTVYCALWYGSILAGFFFIACPILPLLLISPPKFRKCGDMLFACWELYPTALLDLFGVRIKVSGDHISPNDSAILVMNHRTRVDWNFLWAAMFQACWPNIVAHKLKFILKDPIRHIPGPGWIMQMNGFLYITRRWEVDKERLSKTLNYLIALNKKPQLLIFPEGTDLTKTSKIKSDNYARKNNLSLYDYTLHPKTTGFSYLVRHLQNANFLDAVYDLTIAYPDNIPQSEVDLVKGKLPKEVHFHIERIESSDIPKDEDELRLWLEDKWKNKEDVLKKFSNEKTFGTDVECWPMPNKLCLIFALIFWTILTLTNVAMLIVSSWFQIWAIFHVLLFVALSIFTTGFNQVEMGWYWKWTNLFSLNSTKKKTF